MTMGTMEIIRPGLLTTVQDAGRYGYGSSGFSVSGCMDQRAYHDANVLVNNSLSEAVLEMVMMGIEVRFHTNTCFALTGADMQPLLNGKPIPGYCACRARRGDVLSMGMARNGRFGYLAVAGGIQTEPVMGSRSTNLKCAAGGWQGRALRSKDQIPIRTDCTDVWNFYLKEMPVPQYKKQILLRTVAGPQDYFFTEKGMKTFTEECYRVTEESDRMGYRLDGPPIEYKEKTDILSDGIVFGSIQIPSKGTPMVMMADRQTTGGYAKIASVITADLPLLAQCVPGDEVRFTVVSVEEAIRAARKEERERAHQRRKCGYNRRKTYGK